MIIDIHTHFYPDNLAKFIVAKIKQEIGINCYGNGTIAALKEFMQKDGIDFSFNAPVATKPEQVISINRKMVEINNREKFVKCFGAMHPDFNKIGDIKEEIEFLVKNKINVIKLHPEYQNFYPDDGKMDLIYEICIKNDVAILFHSGYDFAFDVFNVHSTPKRFLNLIKKFPELKIILAHLGGYRMWDMVYKLLAGKNVYFDTAFISEISDDSFKSIIYAHGIDKILFGSDFPWERQSTIKEKIERCIENQKDKEKIFYENAQNLIKIKDIL